MAMRNCPYQRSLRSQPVERPKPLKRGQGVGGGNYCNIQTGTRTAPPQQTSRSSNRPRPISSSSSRPGSSSSNSSSTCPAGVAPKTKRQPSPAKRTTRKSTCGPSMPSVCESGPSTQRMSQTGPSTSKRTSSGSFSMQSAGNYAGEIQSPFEPSRIRSTRGLQNPCAPNTPNRNLGGGGTPRSSSTPITTMGRISATPCRPKARSLMSTSSPKPGPSCLRAPPPSGGAKRKVQFSGVPPQGPGPSPDSRSRYKYLPVNKMQRQRPVECDADAEPTSGGSPPGTIYGPSLYPIYPDQYESPYMSLPGPRQVLLMPGDIDPNETTIIDIVGLSEGDIEDVPGIPPHAPASLLEDAWNEYVKDATEKDMKRRKMGEKEGKKASNGCSVRGKKKQEQCYLPTCPPSNYIHQGRAFSFEEYGNVQVDDPNNPPYEGPSFRAPDPECQRARPFSYKSRKTTTRPYTDEERREIEEAGMFRAIKAIINEYNMKWERDRALRGLSEDDLMDIDEDECPPLGEVEEAPRDIFSKTDQLGFGEPYAPRTPEISPKKQRPQSCEEDLIAWDDKVTLMCPTNCPDEADLLTRTPTRTPPRRSSLPSPNLMSMCEPEEDLLGLRTPPQKPRSPTPIPTPNRSDLIRWDSPRAPLPFDATVEETLFDTVTRPSPTAPRLKTPPLRIVRAIPMCSDPNTVVLEKSPHASKPTNQEMEEDDSLGILDFDNPCEGVLDPWQMENFEDDFNKPLPSQGRQTYDPNISGIAPLDDCDDEDLGILDESCMPDFEYSLLAEARLREESKYQTMFQPLAAGGQMLEAEQCPFEPEFDELGRQFQEERADLLNLCHEPEVGPVRKRDFGPLGSELVEQCPDPIEQCQTLISLFEKCSSTPPKRMGPFSRELIESCPEEQQIIDFSDECQPEQRCPENTFSYSKDLFTNVEWDPSMASKQNNGNNNNCS